MKYLTLIAILLLSSVSFAHECVMKARMRNFKVRGDRLYVDVNRRTSYEFDVGVCPYLSWAQRISFNTRPTGSLRVCPGDDVILHDMSGRYIDRCKIWDIHKVER